MKDKNIIIRKYFKKIFSALKNIDEESISNIISIVEEKYTAKKNIFIAGNGGSAAIASHVVSDLNKTILGKNSTNSNAKRFRAICLSDNTPSIMAISNDISYDYVFSEQLKNYANKDDLLIVISASGNSKNIIMGISTAKNLDVQTLGVLGFDGGRAIEMVDDYILINSADYGVIEDCHSVIFHLITDYFKKKIRSGD